MREFMMKKKAFLFVVSILMVFSAWGGDRLETISCTDHVTARMKKANGEKYVLPIVETKLIARNDQLKYPHLFFEAGQVLHLPPSSQGFTGSCWSYSSTSFFESEYARLNPDEKLVKLSEAFAVYWEYVDKARAFVHSKGESVFRMGSQPNGLIRVWKKYGAVPLSAYDGNPKQLAYPDHVKMYREMKDYLLLVKQKDKWNERKVMKKIHEILDRSLGAPPKTFSYEGKFWSPVSFLALKLQLHLDDYIDVMSLKNLPQHQFGAYPVTDNWWNSKRYLNLPLNEFMKIIDSALQHNLSVCIVGDISEPGYDFLRNIAWVPDFDIPSESINDDARQMRFSNEATTDDHAIHIVGRYPFYGKIWYLIKDSYTPAFRGKFPGYFFFHEDYVKLKMMNFLVHKDAFSFAGIAVPDKKSMD